MSIAIDLKHWITLALLVLLMPNAQASSSLLQLILPDKREINLDEAALAALPQSEFKTQTPWTQGMHSFRGPLLTDLLAAQGVKGADRIKASALNGYQQVVELSPFAQAPLILARYQDDQPLTRRHKGPLWLLAPLSEHPKLDVPEIHSCMVWQLISIEVIH